jgi:hypothetical protein
MVHAVKFYKVYADSVMRTAGGGAALETIKDEIAAAAFFDTIFLDGRGRGSRMLQQAINDRLRRLSPQERLRLNLPDRIDVDRQMGPGTLEAFARIANEPQHTAALLDALAKRRRDYWIKRDPKVIPRINHFSSKGPRMGWEPPQPPQSRGRTRSQRSPR